MSETSGEMYIINIGEVEIEVGFAQYMFYLGSLACRINDNGQQSIYED